MKPIDPNFVTAAHRRYSEGLTLVQVAREFGLRSGTTVLYHFQRAGLPTRPRGGRVKESQAGRENGNWKGGRLAHRRRHVRVWLPDHPDADALGYVYEHRLIAEKALGRRLRRHEVVHHVNEDKHDNRPANLLVCTQSYHVWLHRRMEQRARARA